MPNVGPGLPVAPGIAPPGAGYPQWGVSGTVGDNSSWKIAEADSDASKTSLMQQGYAVWFTSKAAAQDFITSQKAAFLNGQIPNPLSGWVHNIEKWLIRGFEMLLGIGLIVIAVAKLAGDTKAGKAAKAVAGKAVLL